MTGNDQSPPRNGPERKGPERKGPQRKAPRSSGPPRRPPQPAASAEAKRAGRCRIADPRSAALEVLEAVREDGAYANLALPAILAASGMDQRDRALATDLAYGTCRALGLLDGILAKCVDRPLGELDGTVHDVLRLGAYQLLRTRIPAHAAVATAVDLVRNGRSRGASGLVNAVLRKVAARDEDEWVALIAPPADRDPVGNAAVRSAHPRWIAQAFADALGTTGPELVDALAADDARPVVHLAARPGRIATAELAAATGGTPARYSPIGVYLDEGNPGEIAAIREGTAAVQDEGSQLVALAVAAAPLDGSDERWLDLAAGPGGKAGLLGAIAAGRGARLDAVEVNEHRANMVRHTVRGLPVTVHQADGRDPGLDPGYDRILLDAPCTGLGALRRRPEARWRRSPADVAELVGLQRDLLASACRLVRVGGVIGYVTCSPHLDETVGVARPPAAFTLVDARPLFPGVPDLGPGPTVQLWPHRHGTDAMFLALLRRDF